MRLFTQCLVAGTVVAALAVGVTVGQAADQKPSTSKAQKASVAKTEKSNDQKVQKSTSDNRWRYTFHNGEWWYWLPEGRWVYWRANQWNKYNANTYVAPSFDNVAGTGRGSSGYGGYLSQDNGSTSDSDIYPFYGRTTAGLDTRVYQSNNEVGPFYGHALPTEVFGPGWGTWRESRPAYGRAPSSGD